jgi:Putative Tad-like Flp pilus-assembly
VTTAEVLCIPGVPGCNRRDGGFNGIKVRSTSTVPTWFGRIVGIKEMKVSAESTACAPCSVKPLDIMLVLDRTGSMCQFGPGQNDPNCTDLQNAKAGVETFLKLLDPSLDKVGLALFPPVRRPDMVSRCPTPIPPNGYKPWSGTSNPNPPYTIEAPASLDGKYFGYDAYWPDVSLGILPGWTMAGRVWEQQGGQAMSDPGRYLVASLEGADGLTVDDYLIETSPGVWEVNGSQSAVVQRLRCTGGAGSTSYALSIEEAQHELERNGRGNVENVIIFLSDGAANTSPTNLPTTHWTNNVSARNRPCGTGVASAAWAKSRGTKIYTIGYDLDNGAATPERCLQAASNGHQGSSPEQCGTWGCTAFDAIRAMATDPDGNGPLLPNFYNKPNPGQLNDIFRAIAIDLSGSRGRLIDDTAPNLLG